MELIASELPDGSLAGTARKSCNGTVKSVAETQRKYVAIFFDPKLNGEATHRPAIRQPPFRKDGYNKLLRMVLARSADPNPPEQDAYFLFDGGKEGIHSDLLRPFGGLDKSCKTISIYKDEDSVTRRFSKVQGMPRFVASRVVPPAAFFYLCDFTP